MTDPHRAAVEAACRASYSHMSWDKLPDEDRRDCRKWIARLVAAFLREWARDKDLGIRARIAARATADELDPP